MNILSNALRKSAANPLTNYTGGLLSSWRKNFFYRVPVEFQKGHFLVKTASSRREFLQVLKLRYEVFHKEYMNKRFPIGLDKDYYDQFSDHLIIIDQRYGKVVGTYRLIVSDDLECLYSNSEFSFTKFFKSPGKKIELSRACIHKDYRTGVVMALLWRGLTDYIRAVDADYLFGLASVKTTDASEILRIHQYFGSKNVASEEFGIKARNPYGLDNFYELKNSVPAESDLGDLIPTLLKSYLRAGAKIHGDPAVDREFRCTDFFMILKMSDLSSSYERKFQVH